MEQLKTISGSTEEQVWSQLETDLFSDDVFNYNALLTYNNREVWFYMDIDLGGGFEGGSEFMQLKAPLVSTDSPFRFAVHDKNFVDVIGKFLGMQDIKIGYPDLDKHLIIKTNDEHTLHRIFADAEVRAVFTGLNSFDCGIHMHHSDEDDLKHPFLELNMNYVIKDAAACRKVFHAFDKLLSAIVPV